MEVSTGLIIALIVPAIITILYVLLYITFKFHRICIKCGWHNYKLFGNKCPNCNEPYKAKVK